MASLLCSSALLASLCALSACTVSGGHAGPDTKQLVIYGVVTEIFQTGNLGVEWGVTVKVETVQMGSYARPEFTFAVHSPAMSGLVKGEHYTIVAVRSKDGYTIDDFQWLKRGEAK